MADKMDLKDKLKLFFRKKNTIPDDFDCSLYLKLNQDVFEAKVDPEKHYLDFGILEGRKYKEDLTEPIFQSLTYSQKFCSVYPKHQNAFDIFKDKWASKVPAKNDYFVTGSSPLFDAADPRPLLCSQSLGSKLSGLKGYSILELGPLEGGHSFQLEQLGAKIVAIEGNTEAFLKCLIVKEALKLNTNFFLGDFLVYLRESEEVYDIIFASGVLYHMSNPLELLYFISKRTKKVFIWTHYYDCNYSSYRKKVKVTYDNFFSNGYELDYKDTQKKGNFWGGLKKSALWLDKEGLLNNLTAMGFKNLTIHDDDPYHPNGPCITIAARK